SRAVPVPITVLPRLTLARRAPAALARLATLTLPILVTPLAGLAGRLSAPALLARLAPLLTATAFLVEPLPLGDTLFQPVTLGLTRLRSLRGGERRCDQERARGDCRQEHGS